MKTKLLLVGCLPKINNITKGHGINNQITKEVILSDYFGRTINDQFIIVDNDYYFLDSVIEANIPFEQVPYPVQIDKRHAIEAKRIINKNVNGTKDKGDLEWINFRKYFIYSKLVEKDFFYPVASDFLDLYGFQHIVIGQGCKNNCTYCAIVFAKRKVESIDAKEIVNEIAELQKNGYTKFALLCDDLGSWGIEKHQKWTYLLDKIAELDDGTMRIALLNVNVNDLLMEKKLLDKHVNVGRICYIEAMAQHVNRTILSLMNRGVFDRAEFIDMVNEYGARGVHINTNFIIGFPGETEKEFLELIEFVKKIRTIHFALYCVPFSEREGTKACLLDNKVSEAVKKERMEQIQQAYQKSLELRLSDLSLDLQNSIKSIYAVMDEYYKTNSNKTDMILHERNV